MTNDNEPRYKSSFYLTNFFQERFGYDESNASITFWMNGSHICGIGENCLSCNLYNKHSAKTSPICDCIWEGKETDEFCDIFSNVSYVGSVYRKPY